MSEATNRNRRFGGHARGDGSGDRLEGSDDSLIEMAERVSRLSAARETETLRGDLAGTVPTVPSELSDTGLSEGFVSDLLLKSLYTFGARSGKQLAEALCLPYGITEDPLMSLRQRQLVEVRGSTGPNAAAFTFEITSEGRVRARELLEGSRYVGPAPIPMQQYWHWARAQSATRIRITRAQIARGLRRLVLDEEFVDTLGPAINSGRSLFLYGEAGNGKTTIAEAVAAMLGGAIFVPYAIEADGQIIQIYDPHSHRPAPSPGRGSGGNGEGTLLSAGPDHDERFVRIHRPAVIVGGELTLEQLELQRDEQTGVYRAPPQVKANGGVFIIDDFGRQRVRPRDLLNRWMVPLERQVDLLDLPIGHKLAIPFECFLIFATNLDPAELVEEAFLRRIRYKIHVDSPSRDQFRSMFRRQCEERGIPFESAAVSHIYQHYYDAGIVEARACHPRDLVDHIVDMRRYSGTEVTLSGEAVEAACRSYFVDMTEAAPVRAS
jgi:predicted ATPase with chaperone activity